MGYRTVEWACEGEISLERADLLEKIAPCSLVCHTCTAYEHGVICESAKQLLKYLEGVGEFYEQHCPEEAERFLPFAKELEKYGSGHCSGCRNREHHSCSIKGCFILDCTKQHGVDFCGECDQFPCDKTRTLFEEEVYVQWLEGNQKIKLYGIEEFWKENGIRPHYLPYKKDDV